MNKDDDDDDDDVLTDYWVAKKQGKQYSVVFIHVFI